MRALSSCGLAAVILTFSIAPRMYAGDPCGCGNPCPQPAPADCVQGPPSKVVIQMSPPEVVFQQAPSAPCSRPCLAHHTCRLWQPQAPLEVQSAPATVAFTTFAVQQQAAVPVMAM